MGELAAIFTSLLWSFTSVQFTLAGRRIGSAAVNRLRLVLAVIFLSIVHTFVYGSPWPVDAELFRWGWLGLSGVIGLVGGDAALFQAFVLIGPRRSMLLMTLVPVISVLLAWVWLGEILVLPQLLAIVVTVAGVAWVVGERSPGAAPGPMSTQDSQTNLKGILLGLGGAVGQAVGLVMAKQGLVDNFPSLSATLMRMVVALVVIWLLTLFQGKIRATVGTLKDHRAALFLFGGAVTGPFLGVWMSMIAVQNAQVGIASTLMSLTPIMLIPLAYWIFGDRITLRSLLGTIIALAGAAALFFV
jgi:drug/metabolite transporter (DMT)-like permease